MLLARLNKTSKLLSSLAPFVCLAGIVILQGQQYKKSVQKLNTADYLAQEREQAKLVDWQKRSPNLGFGNLKADLTYLNFVQYFGDENARKTIGYKLVPNYFDAITHSDPQFTQAYLRLAVANSMYAGDPEATIALTERGLEAIAPESEDAALLWTSKGLDELLFMGDKKAAVESYKMAEEWTALAKGDRAEDLEIKDLETVLQSTTEIDLKEAQIRAWSSVLVHIRDNRRRGEIIDKIGELKAEIIALKQAETNANQ